MQLITHQSHLDAFPMFDLNTRIQSRFDQLSEDTDVPQNIVLGEVNDNIVGPDYAFMGNNGLLSDLLEELALRLPSFSGNTYTSLLNCMLD